MTLSWRTHKNTSRHIQTCLQAWQNQNVLFKGFLKQCDRKNKMLSISFSICHCLSVSGFKASAFLFSSPIIITHISCRLLLKIFIDSPSYAIYRTRHSSCESHSKEERGKYASQTGWHKKGAITKTVNVQDGERLMEVLKERSDTQERNKKENLKPKEAQNKRTKERQILNPQIQSLDLSRVFQFNK